jgi:hypothetical protein
VTSASVVDGKTVNVFDDDGGDGVVVAAVVGSVRTATA